MGVIRSMKAEIAGIFGEGLNEKVSSLLENLGGMTDIIEANFSQIKDLFQKYKEDVIKSINQEKNKEISDLKNDIKAKDDIISLLTLKEG